MAWLFLGALPPDASEEALEVAGDERIGRTRRAPREARTSPWLNGRICGVASAAGTGHSEGLLSLLRGGYKSTAVTLISGRQG